MENVFFLYFRLAATEQKVITDAMQHIESATAVNNVSCVRFRPRIPSDPYYITIINGTGCSSTVNTTNTLTLFSPISSFAFQVGQNTGSIEPRVVTLQQVGCIYQGLIIHELLHTLGHYHYFLINVFIKIARIPNRIHRLLQLTNVFID